jgi:Cu2+-exporting ATPase
MERDTPVTVSLARMTDTKGTAWPCSETDSGSRCCSASRRSCGAGWCNTWSASRRRAFPGSHYVPALFGTAVYFYGGLVFVKGGLQELRERKPGMMTLISLAITVAFVFSLAVTLGYSGEALWWELASLVTIMLLGHWIEMRSISQASGALRELAKLLPSTAQRILGETIEDVPISVLREGDVVLVRPGASVPADGIVLIGKSDVNESMITGESVPVPKVEGANVIAGTVNGSGSLRVTVTGTGERTRHPFKGDRAFVGARIVEV